MFKALTTPDSPVVAGNFRPLRIVTEPGSVVHAVPPMPTFTLWTGLLGGEVVLKALAQGMPDRVPACSGGDVCSMMGLGVNPRTGEQWLEATNEAVGFDGISDDLLEGSVHIEDGRITAIGGPPRETDQVLDARGRTVLPGLIDAHCHAYGIDLDLLKLESAPLSYVALVAARRLTGALSRGFTTVRDPCGGDAGLARAIAEGLLPSPRYLWTGAALSQTGGHGDVRAADSALQLG